MHSVIRRSPSSTSTVADPSTVTVRIESASTCDLNVQDVSTTSSSGDEDLIKPRRKKQTLTDRFNYRSSSITSRRHTSTFGNQHHHHHHHRHHGISRLSTDINAMRVAVGRPSTAASLPGKSSGYDNEWDIDSAQTSQPSAQQQVSTSSSISPTTLRSKSSSPTFPSQQVPSVFTTTSECLGSDLRSQVRRSRQRRSQSTTKPPIIISDPASPTIPLVFLTDDIVLGSIRALQNERQLCKLAVEYIIDASNMRPDELARKANAGARLPCQCGHTHSRCILTLEFDQLSLSSSSSDSNYLNNSKTRESSRTQLEQLFSAVNRFISKAQQEEKRTLIYGFELTPNSPLAVIAMQYLMLCDELPFTEAMHRVHSLFPILPKKHQQFPIMDKRFQDYLKHLNTKLLPKNYLGNTISGDGGSSSSGNEYHRPSKDISSESPEITTTMSTSVTSWTTFPTPIMNDNTNQSQQILKARSAWDR